MKDNQKYIDKLKEKIISFELTKNDRSEFDELNIKYKTLKSKLMNFKKEEDEEYNNKELNNELIDRIKELKAENVSVTIARDKFRSLTLDQKHEIRKLKSKNSGSLRD